MNNIRIAVCSLLVSLANTASAGELHLNFNFDKLYDLVGGKDALAAFDLYQEQESHSVSLLDSPNVSVGSEQAIGLIGKILPETSYEPEGTFFNFVSNIDVSAWGGYFQYYHLPADIKLCDLNGLAAGSYQVNVDAVRVESDLFPNLPGYWLTCQVKAQ